MRNEVQVNIKDLIRYIVKQWKYLILACFIGAACISGVFLVMELKNRNVVEIPIEESNEPEVDLEKLRETLTEEDAVEVEQALEFYLTSEENYKLLKEYVANSIKYRIDATHTPTYRVMYAIDGVIKNDDNRIQNEIFTIISNWIKGEDTIKRISEIAGLDVDTIYVQELLGVQYSDESNCVTFSAIALDKEMCEKLMAAVKTVFEQQIEELRTNYATLEVRLISEIYSVELNTNVQTSQYSQLSQLHSMKAVLTAYRFELDEKQQIYYDALYADVLEEESEENGENINQEVVKGPLFNAKITVLGAIAGVLVVMFYFLMRYLLSDTLKVKEDICETFGQHVFCEITKNDDLALLQENIRFIGEKRTVKKLLITGTYNDEDIEGIKGRLKDNLGNDYEVITTNVFEADSPENARILAEHDAMICIEKIGVSSYKKIEMEINLSRYYDVPVLGFVLLK